MIPINEEIKTDNYLKSSGNKVALGMSGGVDSSTSVYLLQQAGYEVIGVHMLLVPERFQTNQTSMEDAKSVALKMNIPFYVLDLREKFENVVMDYFANAYRNGLTPNPCVFCNQNIKFDLFAKECFKLGADYISTGHYVRKQFSEKYQKYLFAKAKDAQKDQSYFLSMVNTDIIDKCIFPLSDMTKNEIRNLAAELNLSVAEKKDSQEICFIANDNYKSFLKAFLPNNSFRKGNIVDITGTVLGNHESIMNYTIGQRKGLGISLGKPAYVIGINAGKNEVILGEGDNLFHTHLSAIQTHFFADIPYDTLYDIEAKIRYRTKPAIAKLIRHRNDTADVFFAEAQRAITPGQCVSFYDGDLLVGGGWIDYTNK